MNQFGNPTIDQKYILEKYLGHGGTSKVFLANSMHGQVAVKVIRKDKKFSRSDEQGLIKNEAKVMQAIGYHPNVINMVDHNLDGVEIVHDRFYDISYMVVENCPNGSLYDFIKKHGPFDQYVASFYFKQLIHAVKHLHEQNIAHCDIKPGNIFFDEYYNLKLGDFGCALQMKGKNYGVTKCFGTRTYMAPEVFKASMETPFSPFQSDVYALGATLYFMLTGDTPNAVDTNDSTNQDTDGSYFQPNADIGDIDRLDMLTMDMVEMCTFIDPKKRPNVEFMLEHPWMDDRKDPDFSLNIFEYMSQWEEEVPMEQDS